MRLAVLSAFAAAVLAAGTAAAQPDPHAGAPPHIHFTYVQIDQTTPLERRLPEVFDSLLSHIRAHDPGFHYQTARTQALTYGTPCRDFVPPAIVTLSPAKFLQCRDQMGKDTLVPLFVVRKRHERDAYYSASFISAAGSPIQNLSSPGINRLVLVDSNSASGYIAPVNKLWEMGVIDAPTLDGVRREGWAVSFVGSHRAVSAAVSADSFAIGATDEYESDAQALAGRTKTLLHYSTLPQDVIAITRQLLPHRRAIEQGLGEFFAADSAGNLVNAQALTLSQASTGLTGVVPFSSEHQNAFAELARMRERLHGRQVPLVFRNIGREGLMVVAAVVFLVLAAAGFLVGNVLGLGSGSAPRIALVCTVALLAVWVAVFAYPHKLPIDRRIALFLLLAVGATCGVLMRWVFNALEIGIPGRKPGPAVPGGRLPLELAGALMLAFGFAILYLVSGQLLFGKAATLDESTEFQRVGGALSLLGLTAAVMLEDSAAEFFKRLRNAVFGERKDKPAPAAPAPSAGTAPAGD